MELVKEQYKIEQLLPTHDYIQMTGEVFAIMKEQEKRIFDLTFYDMMDGDLVGYLHCHIADGEVLVCKEDEKVVAYLILDNAYTFGNIITNCNIHLCVDKSHWGKQSRDIANKFLEYLNKNYYIKKIIAEVPQCSYGIIKLLKDINFTHEGTLKEALLYHDKDNNPKWYDKLIYTYTREDL